MDATRRGDFTALTEGSSQSAHSKMESNADISVRKRLHVHSVS